MAPPPTTRSQSTLGADLEIKRLEHRARRLRFAITALRSIADGRAPGGPTSTPMHQALDDFTRELSAVEERLAEVSSPTPRIEPAGAPPRRTQSGPGARLTT